jgi:hypothetical protein
MGGGRGCSERGSWWEIPKALGVPALLVLAWSPGVLRFLQSTQTSYKGGISVPTEVQGQLDALPKPHSRDMAK